MVSDLSPEKKRTLQFLLDHWPKHLDILNSKPIPQQGIPSGFFRFSYDPVSADELPKEDHWIWRQCNARIAVVLDATTTVVMRKLNTRANKTKNAHAPMHPPSFKMWNLRVVQTCSTFTFLYCEKGVEETKAPLDSSSLQEEIITGELHQNPTSDLSGSDWYEGFCESSDLFSSVHSDADDSTWPLMNV